MRKDNSCSREAFGRRLGLDVESIHLYVASVGDVIIAKLEWAKFAQSQRHIEDVASILKLRKQGVDEFYLEKWVSRLDLMREWEAEWAERVSRKRTDQVREWIWPSSHPSETAKGGGQPR